MTTKITEQNISNLANVGVQWQAVKTSDFTAVAGEGYFVDTTSAAVEVTLPSSPNVGDTIAIKDYASTFGTNALTIARNGNNIQGVANNSEISTNRTSIVLVYIDATKGWLYTNESNVADLQSPLFTEATGGTITTSGDFKIHSFTGDGCFVVTQLGNSSSVPTGGPSNVDYLVIAGGGGASAQGGGGGAGGYRTSFPSPGCNAGAFPITATTYPITVGAGGSGAPGCGGGAVATNGSNSVFSTITSAGGGLATTSGDKNGNAGGSGGGGSATVPGSPTGSGGAGNTPPVSPPQGNPGGNAGSNLLAGGGGGAGAAGTNQSGPTGGPGGNGLANSITGSSVTRAGGGGGGFWNGVNGPGGTGGSGGGGCAVGPYTAGAANTGGGGGGAPQGNTGGKGIVILRYKFQ